MQEWGEIYERLAPLIHRRCLSLLGDEQETLDATHDVFLLLQRHIHTFRGESEFTTWVYRVTVNHCLNRIRAQKIRGRALARLERVEASAPLADPSSELSQRDLARALLSRLPPRRAAILYHCVCDERTQPEVAEVLGISERTVRKELKRALEELRGFEEAPSPLADALGA